MRTVYKSILFLFVCAILNSMSAQMMKRIEIKEGTPVFNFPELGAIIIEEDGVVKVLFAPPAEMRPKANKDANVQDDDIVLFANGKRIRNLDALKEIVAATKVDSAVQLGLKRGDNRFMTVVKKVDPADLPKRRMVMRNASEDVQPLPGLHALIKKVDGKPVVSEAFEMESKTKPEVQKDDVITHINGEAVASYESLFTAYEKLDVGSTVKIAYERAGKKMSVSFEKPKVKMRMMKK